MKQRKIVHIEFVERSELNAKPRELMIHKNVLHINYAKTLSRYGVNFHSRFQICDCEI